MELTWSRRRPWSRLQRRIEVSDKITCAKNWSRHSPEKPHDPRITIEWKKSLSALILLCFQLPVLTLRACVITNIHFSLFLYRSQQSKRNKRKLVCKIFVVFRFAFYRWLSHLLRSLNLPVVTLRDSVSWKNSRTLALTTEMPGYRLTPKDKKDIGQKYLCNSCLLLLRDAIQTKCGHFYCQSCLGNLRL